MNESLFGPFDVSGKNGTSVVRFLNKKNCRDFRRCSFYFSVLIFNAIKAGNFEVKKHKIQKKIKSFSFRLCTCHIFYIFIFLTYQTLIYIWNHKFYSIYLAQCLFSKQKSKFRKEKNLETEKEICFLIYIIRRLHIRS